MTRLIFTLLIGIVAMTSCKKEPVDRPQVCLKIQHHQALMPNTKVYFKYNDSVFPGYDLDKLDIFDANFQVDETGEGCFEGLPLGTHWLVAHGRDEEWGDDGQPIRGSIRINLTATRFQLDSIIYVQEY
ncbi:MAG: hypothetical protein ACJAT4_001043 [Granulosicoccus sp.]|jgi:hypothetical protein